jgi:hypothetical protein
MNSAGVVQSDAGGFQTFAKLFEAVRHGVVDGLEFDDALWLLTANRVYRLNDLKELPAPVLHYFASRLIEREVGNGGFAQAADNALEWFGVAAAGYEAIGCFEAASRIRQVAAASESEEGGFGIASDRHGDIADVVASVDECQPEEFDEGLDEIGWWAIERRLAYVLDHQDAFVSLDPPTRH